MKNLFESIAPINAVVVATEGRSSFSAYLNADITLSKGEFKQPITIRANVYDSFWKGYQSFDDLDWDDNGSILLGSVPIDDLKAFKKSLVDSGLKTLSESIGISDDEIRKVSIQALQDSKAFKKLFGKNAKLFEALSDKEQNIVKVDKVIAEYDTIQKYHKTQFNIDVLDVDGDLDKSIPPTLEQLIKYRNSLKD